MIDLFVKREDFSEDYAREFLLDTGSFKVAYARASPTLFASYMLNVKPRDYQHFFFKQIIQNDRLLVVKARQLGFTTAVALFSFWACFFNKFPSGVSKNTKIGIVSKEDDAAKKVLLTVRDLINQGDVQMSKVLKGRKEWSQHFFTNRLKEPNTTEVITFQNGSFIKSFPPTAKVRGNSFDVVFVDEAAFLRTDDPEGFFYKVIEPTTVATNGKIVVLSTPNGEGGFFYKLADPNNVREKHDYKRLFFHYSINDDPKYLSFVQKQKEIMDVRDWSQEYCCDFVSSASRFFIPEKVEAAVDPVINQTDYSGKSVSVGVDYGMNHSRTVISVSLKEGDLVKVIKLIRFDSGADVNQVIPKIKELMREFKVDVIIPDDCPQGNAINNQMISLGWNVKPFNFTSSKIAAYVKFRSFLNQGRIKLLKNDVLLKEMLELKQEETKQAKLSIHKPTGGTDDCIDSVIMSTSPLIDDLQKFNVILV